jgi:Protein of unknown function (DUF1579)
MSHEADLDTALTHLAALAGDWDGTEHLSDTPWTTRGSASGSHKLRLATGGLTLVQDYQQWRRGAITLTGHGVFAVDPESADLLWWWFDDFGHPPLTPSRGRFDHEGGVVVDKTSPRGRQRAHFARSGDLLIHRIEVAPTGASGFTPVVDASYRRR